MLYIVTFFAAGLLSVFVNGQNEVCAFYHLNASCRYRIDGICLSEITVTIDQCTDPIQVKFTITCERDPVVRFSHTFSAPDTLVAVHGFYKDVKLRVRLRWKKNEILNVEADFKVYGLPDTDFMNEDVKIHSLEEACGSLNEAGKIAIGVMAGLFVIAGILLIVLLVIRRQRKLLTATQSRSALVNEPELLTETTPQRLSRIEESGLEESENMQNSDRRRHSREATHSDSVTSRETLHNQFSSREIIPMQMQQKVPDGDKGNTQEASVRFSDILRQQDISTEHNSSNGVVLSPTVV